MKIQELLTKKVIDSLTTEKTFTELVTITGANKGYLGELLKNLVKRRKINYCTYRKVFSK